jgi:pilus assembly protein CpaB
MKLRVIVLVVLALAVAFGTAQLARHWLAGQRAALAAAKKAEKPAAFVLVAVKDLPTGSFVQTEDLRWQAWPGQQVSESYLRKGKDKPEALAGAVVRLRIAAGEPVTVGRVIKPGDRGFLAAVLNPGMRAVSVPVTTTSGVAGLVFPGDRIDLILSHMVPDQSGRNLPPRAASETILSDIRVLAVDQTTNDQANKPVLAKTVTFEVTPKQAEAIEVAADLGKLSLSLRSLASDNVDDSVAQVADANTVSYTWDSDVSPLLVRRPHPVVAPPAPVVVTILRGEGSGPARGGAAGAPTSVVGTGNGALPAQGMPISNPVSVTTPTGAYR